MQRFFISLGVALGLLVPAFALAQTSSTGLLTVYVLVNNQSGTSYSPGNFTVSVSGSNVSLNSFAGSQSGTPVSLYPGSYRVTAIATNGFTPSYSVGCDNTIAAGQTQTCVITMSQSYNYYNQPQPYPYAYQYLQPLSCQANVSAAALGQTVSFRAVGGQGGTYNWSTAYQNYPNSGSVLTVAFNASGMQVVTVTNASQTATCTVNVSSTYAPGYTTPGFTSPAYSYYTTPTYTGYPSYPQLPRTGFGPHDGALAAAIAAVLLIAAGIITAPYARKALTIALR